MSLLKRFMLFLFASLFLLSLSAPILADGDDGIPDPTPPPIAPDDG
jgi:hypothetical protein